MNNFLADFKNDNNWQQVYQDDKNVIYDAAGGYTSLPAFEVPITFDKDILVVRTLSKNARFTWNYSGVISQRMQLGGGFTPLPVASLFSERLRINRSTFVYFPSYNTDYEILFEPYRWIKHINLTIWQYVGELNNYTDALIKEIRDNQLDSIESKIDDIANYNY